MWKTILLCFVVGGLLLLVLVIAGLVFFGWQKSREYEQLTDTHDLGQRLATSAAKYIEPRKNVRLSMGVWQRGRHVVREFGNGRPPAAAALGKTFYEIGSITKVFTSIWLASIEADKSVTLDTTVGELLPKDVTTTDAMRAITLRQLSTHSSGLPRLPGNFLPLVRDEANPYVSYGSKDLYASLLDVQLEFAPGKKSVYSNYGAGLLGQLLVERTGKRYEAGIVERICQPLHLADTTITLSDEQRQRRIGGHAPNGKPTAHWDFDALASTGALQSTVDDLLGFAQANLHPPADPVGTALTRTHAEHFRNWSDLVGLGWQIKEDPFSSLTIHWHNGGTGGFVSWLGFVKSHDVAVVVLSNYGDAMAGDSSVDALGFELLKLATKVSLEGE